MQGNSTEKFMKSEGQKGSKPRMHSQTLKGVFKKAFPKGHPMRDKLSLLCIQMVGVVYLENFAEDNEEQVVFLFEEISKWIYIDTRFSGNNFLSYIEDEFEKLFKRETAQNTLDKFAMLNYVRFLLLRKNMNTPEANNARRYISNLPKNNFVYDKLNVTPESLNLSLMKKSEAIIKHALEISGIEI